MKLNVGKKVKIIKNLGQRDYSQSRLYVEECMNKRGIIVDSSDSHGLCYGVIFPKRIYSKKIKCGTTFPEYGGFYGNQRDLDIFWFEPEELKFVR